MRERLEQEEESRAIVNSSSDDDNRTALQVAQPPERNQPSARNLLWIRVLSALCIALALDVLLSMTYIYRKDIPGSAEKTTTTTAVVVSAKLYNTTLPNWKPLPDSSATLTKVAFGSCSSQNMPQPHWDTIIKYKPDLLLLTGDNVYGDCEEETCHHLRQAYADMASHASVQGAASRIPIFATIDDHGQGSSHADNPYKEIAREFFVEFFQITQLRPGSAKDDEEGVYRSAAWGPPGQRLQVILLDTRYSRSPFTETGNVLSPYEPNDDYSELHLQMLSKAQWTWLEQELQKPAELRLLVSSIQVLNNGTGFEAWRHLPTERQRLYNLIAGKSVFILSGDRHFGGFYQSTAGSSSSSSLLLEVTASSFTHTVPLGVFDGCATAQECDEVDPSRVGDAIRVNHFGSIEIDSTLR